MAQLWYIVVFCVLVSPTARGQVDQECFGAFETSDDQGLDFDSGASVEGPIRNVSDREACLSACCNKEDCHLAIVGMPQDGPAQCYLVNCMKDGNDVCRMLGQKGSTAYKKRPKARAADSTDKCSAPAEVGSCRAAFPRFYYNGTSCESFIYGGCEGNGNNFETVEACNAACNGTSGAVQSNEIPSGPAARRMAPADLNASDVFPAGPSESSPRALTAEDFAELCQAEVKTGPCRASIPRFFYNSTAGTCQSFIYGGCRGNSNNYGSAEECQTTCSGTATPSSRKAPEENSSGSKSSESCVEKQDTGPCRAAFPRFYFDPASQSCQPFIYGGCQGNGNRFHTVEDCMSLCSGQEGSVAKHDHPSNRTPAYIMVGTLAVSAAVALAGLILLALRKTKFPRRSRDDKEELLPEDQLATEQNA
ncbi:hypothetical protein ANANG_G00237890 [Anguilla anguilla]|uniref:Serine peptidase inhibitor, Kunitz type, 2 n=1 Tax=Anguilla anguilla TaxID=7936 RepID=A0A9D3LUM1_ANGAN|nr:hypothetical protein ANANG_G00237890 [Anguilla anguilla]